MASAVSARPAHAPSHAARTQRPPHINVSANVRAQSQLLHTIPSLSQSQSPPPAQSAASDIPKPAQLRQSSLPELSRDRSSLDGSAGECPEHRRKRLIRQQQQQSQPLTTASPVADTDNAAGTAPSSQSLTVSSPSSLLAFESRGDVGVILADREQHITHVNKTFEAITGYSCADSIGRNCSFLQGKYTSSDAKSLMRLAITNAQTVQLPVLNYRKNGLPFWNLLTIAPMFDASGTVSHYIGLQIPQSVVYIDRPMPLLPWNSSKTFRVKEPSSAPATDDDDGELPRQSSLPHTRSMMDIANHKESPLTLMPALFNSGNESPDHLLLAPPKIVELNDADSKGNSDVSSDTVSEMETETDSASSGISAATIQPLNAQACSEALRERRKSINSLINEYEALKITGASSSSSSTSSISSTSHALPPAMARATPISFVAETLLPTVKGKYRVRAYQDQSELGALEHREIMVIVWGRPEQCDNVPLRVHDACFTSEVLHSLKCDCRQQLDFAMDFIQSNPQQCGIIVYMPQEGRGIGLANKIKVYSVQERGYDTVDANRVLGFPDDLREYSAVPSILDEMGVRSVALMTNNPRKTRILAALGVHITGRIPVVMDTNEHSHGYVAAKRARMGHLAE